MIVWLGLPILAVLATARCAFRTGGWMMRGFRFHSEWERAAFATGAGLAALSWALLLVGLCGGLYRWALWPAIAVVALSDVNRWRRPKSWRWALLLLLLLPFLAPALSPPLPGDSLLYHLPMAKQYALSHTVRPVWWLRFPVLPLGGELLLALQYALAGELAAQLNQLLVLSLICLTLYAWGARRFSPAVGVLAAAAFAGNPIAANLGTSGYTDLTLALAFTLALYAAANWRATDERGWLWAAGAFAGWAASCKYTGLLALLFVAATARRPRDLVPIVCAALLMAAPFYIYITVSTGNPLFPFYSHWFGYRYWNEADVAEQVRQMARTGAGRSLRALLLLPWNLVFHGEHFDFEGDPSAFCLLALPAMALAARSDRRVRPLLLAVAAWLPLWFWRAQFPRYLAPIAPALHLAAAASLLWVAERAPRVARRLVTPPVLAGAALCLLLPTLAELIPLYRRPIPRNAGERYQYLSARVPGFAMVAKLNRATGGDYTLYAFRTEMALFADGAYLGDWFGPGRYIDFTPSFTVAACERGAHPPQLERLRAFNVDHVLLPRAMLPGHDCPWFHVHFQPRFQDDWFVLFRVLY